MTTACDTLSVYAYVDEDGMWCARGDDDRIPGLFTQGITIGELHDNILAAADLLGVPGDVCLRVRLVREEKP